MNDESQDRYFSVGPDYFIFEGKYRIVVDLVTSFLKEKKIRRLLDAGCGSGNLLMKKHKYALAYGCDISLHALRYAHQKGEKRIFCADLVSLPIRSQSFDLVFAIDAIEHIEEDIKAVAELYRIIARGGFLIATVPSFMCLWGNHDIFAGHYRRYRIYQFRQLIESTGFIVEKISYIEPEFFFPAYIIRKVKSMIMLDQPKDDFFKVPRSLNYLMTKIIELEKYWLRYFNFPFGVSILCCAKKP
jgi:SAM-dependent methyltransferase